MKAYTYLLVDFFTVIVCFVFSFHPRIRFDRHFPAFFKASVLVALPFIAWDVHFEKSGIWWFNHDYTLGIDLLGLPLEEWLFFICIPFSCVFTYYCFNKFFYMKWADAPGKLLAVLVAVACATALVFYGHQTYTSVTAVATIATLAYLTFAAKAPWIGQATIVYIVLLAGFFPVNGILTGTGLEAPIVNYNPNEILNIRMLTIPIEDAFYGYTLFLLNVLFFNYFDKQATSNL